MLKSIFDPSLDYRVVIYLRMSSDLQNERSPEQQEAEIRHRLQSLGCPWQIVKVYTDRAKSGRLQRNRPDYQRMMDDIRSGAVVTDLILVDTLERLGRLDDMTTIRKELRDRHGVLVLTADSGFADPTTPQGRALGMVEAFRSTEDGRIKAYNVLRGKRDTVRQNYWPGGPPPFGYALNSVETTNRGRRQITHCTLVPDPQTSWIIRTLFATAAEKGWGATRLARFLNGHPEIAAELKPFHTTTICRWLDNPIYCGELVFGRISTGIVDDARVTQRNPDDELIRIPDFCEPLVSREQWTEVQSVRQVRRDRLSQRKLKRSLPDGKLIAPPAPGLTVNYLLSGLVYCGHCGLRMIASSGRPYTMKSGETRRYTTYVCPGYLDRACPNNRRVSEPWLREQVVNRLLTRLFPKLGGDAEGRGSNSWLTDLIDEVRCELTTLAQAERAHGPDCEQEIATLEGKKSGWLQSLANPNMPASIRDAILSEWSEADARVQELRSRLQENENREHLVEQAVDESDIMASLGRLPEILAASNATLGNLELSLHIDRIVCHSNGQVVMRTCKVGSFTEALDMLTRTSTPPEPVDGPSEKDDQSRGVPRRRGRLRVDKSAAGKVDLRALADFAADPNRFAAIDDRWFCTDRFQLEKRKGWAEQHAAQVAARRREGLTEAALATEFGKTIPTIHAALRYAAQDDAALAELPRKMPRARWHEDHALEVASFKKESGMGTDELASHFGKSDTTIRKALAHAAAVMASDGSDTDDRMVA